jgi:hypothetical protein
MNGGEESYCGIVPAKQANQGKRSLAEAVEGRPKEVSGHPLKLLVSSEVFDSATPSGAAVTVTEVFCTRVNC